MAKKTQLDKAIEAIDADIAVLQAAKARLVAQAMMQAFENTAKVSVRSPDR